MNHNDKHSYRPISIFSSLSKKNGAIKNGTIAAFLTIKNLRLYETRPFYSQTHALNFDMEAFNLTINWQEGNKK